jgi:hypothetical protein
VTRAIRFGTPLCAALLLTTTSAQAQTPAIRFQGRGEIAIDTVLERIVASGRYRLLSADTVYPATDTIAGPVLIAATTAKFEGVIEGDVAIVDANVFLRPGSRITGDVVSIGAGLFRAPNATIEGSVREWPDARYYAVLDDDGVRITGSGASSLFDLDGFGGFHMPTYDRVAGFTAAIGARYLLPRIGLTEPDIHGWVGYQTARERLIGGLDFGIRRGDYRVSVGAERLVLSNDAWVRGWTNSVSYLWGARDHRDYYGADRFFVRQTLSRGTLYSDFTFAVTGQIEDARSVPSLDPWHLRNDDPRPNPLVDDGRITSLVAGVDGRWEYETWLGSFDAAVESAAEIFDGDHAFTRFDIGGEIAMRALADHTLRVEVRFRGPIGSDSLPRQRWSIIGGGATLPTTEIGDLRGDRLVWAETDYIIPVPGVYLPFFEQPTFELLHRVGSAWRQGGDSDLIQNIGVRLRARIFWIRAVIDPSDSDAGALDVGISLPRRYPWSTVY